MTARSKVKDVAWSAYVWPKGSFGNRVQGAVIGALETRRVRREWRRSSRVLLVHTPGKVGSKALFAALKASRQPDDAIFHTHRVNPDNMAGVKGERQDLAPRRTWYTADFLGQRLRQAHDKEVVVLAAVRDPIERSLSAFLQNAERYGDSARPITAATRVDTDDIARQFVAYFDPQAITQWIDIELNAMFGVDVFAAPFDHGVGFQVAGRDALRVGVIRHDRFGDALLPFIRTLTGLDPPVVGRVNDSSTKAYGVIYRELRTSLHLPEALVDEVYDTRYARHFFTAAERQVAVRRWTGQSGMSLGRSVTADATAATSPAAEPPAHG